MNQFEETINENILLIKLLTKGHLNVYERRSLPNGKVRESAVKELITNSLKRNGWFPGNEQRPIGNEGGDYIQLEYKTDGSGVLHLNCERSLYQYGHITTEYKSIDALITAYLKFLDKNNGIDGIHIDWNT